MFSFHYVSLNEVQLSPLEARPCALPFILCPLVRPWPKCQSLLPFVRPSFRSCYCIAKRCRGVRCQWSRWLSFISTTPLPPSPADANHPHPHPHTAQQSANERTMDIGRVPCTNDDPLAWSSPTLPTIVQPASQPANQFNR